MAKSKREKDATKNARRKLVDAQAKLQLAHERRARVVAKAEDKIEVVRQRETARVEKATEEVQLRQAKVARAETRVIAAESSSGSSDALYLPGPDSTPSQISTTLDGEPIGAIEVEGEASNSLIVPGTEGAGMDERVPAGELDPSALRLLISLRDTFPESGAAYTEWLAVAGISKRTFLNARSKLVEHGLVVRDGKGQGAHYRLSSTGSDALARQ